MSHSITAVIGVAETVERLATMAGGIALTPIGFGLVIAPLGPDQIDRLTKLQPGEYRPGFTYLSAALEDALLQAAGSARLAYIETNYFGGAGMQAAAVYQDGQTLLRSATATGPRLSGRDSPVNGALRALGVSPSPGRDEFEAAGLDRFRSLDDLGLAEADD